MCKATRVACVMNVPSSNDFSSSSSSSSIDEFAVSQLRR